MDVVSRKFLDEAWKEGDVDKLGKVAASCMSILSFVGEALRGLSLAQKTDKLYPMKIDFCLMIQKDYLEKI